MQTGLGLWWLVKGTAANRMTVVFFAMLIGGLAVGAWSPIQMLKPPVYQEDSPYQQVRIREDDLFRYLVLDRTFHAVMWKAEPVTLFLPYSQLMVSSLALVPEAKRALVLGHGGGSFAKWLARYWPDLDLDVVEFDPVVVKMAEDFFSYRPPSRHHVYVRDARAYLNGTTETYDLIWVDAFARHLVPFHLTTQEFFSDLRKHLTPEGVVVVNLAASGNRGDLGRAKAVVQTMKQSFPSSKPMRSKDHGRPNRMPKIFCSLLASLSNTLRNLILPPRLLHSLNDSVFPRRRSPCCRPGGRNPGNQARC